MKNKALLLVSALTLFTGLTFSQTTVNHSMTFNSGNRYMWGSSNGSFYLDKTTQYIDVNEDFDESEDAIVDLSLFGEFGVEASAEFDAELEAKMRMRGFQNGTVRVNYPITTSLTFPNDNSYDQGDWVTVNTNYNVNNGYSITSNFMDNNSDYRFSIPFDFSASLGIEVLIGYTSFTIDLLDGAVTNGPVNPPIPGPFGPLIPGGGGFGSNNFSGNSAFGEINLALVNNNGLYVGTGNVNGIGLSATSAPMVNISAGGNTLNYPLPTPYDLNASPWWHENIFNEVGILDLEADLPDVNLGATTLAGQNLLASGNHEYFDVDVDLMQFLSKVTPSPASDVLSNLSGSYEVDGIPPMIGDIADIDWTLFSATMDMRRRVSQDLEFRPNVFAQFTFPVAVEWQEIQSGSVVNSGNSRFPTVRLGNQLRYKYPCYYEEMDISVRYSINGRFYNHTYDECPTQIDMEAFYVDVNLPDIILVPEISIDACIDVPYPCGSFLDPQICYEELCPDEEGEPIVIVEEVSYNLPNFEIGPEWSETVNITNYASASDENWINSNWTLGGFNPVNTGPFTMRANPITVSNTASDVSCFGAGDGSINVTINAVSHATPYSYNWTHGATNQDPAGLNGGNYAVQIEDANGCDFSTGATVFEPSELIAVFTKTDKSCGGGVDNGSIDVTVSGGEPPYDFNWSNGAITEDLSGLSAGTYTLTVTDNRSCTEVITIDIDEPNVLGQNASITPVNCLGGNDGAIDITPFGGSLPYSYNWSGGQSTEDISGISAGPHTLTITDGKGCVDLVTHTVTEPPTAVNVTSSAVEVSCFGGGDGSVDITTSGGTPGYTFSWVSDVGGFLPFTTEDINSLPTGTYTVIATDNNGCQVQISQFVDQPSAPLSSTPIITNVLCFGDATGSIDPGISGGTAPYNYVWSGGATTPILTNAPSGNYSLTVTDNRGCSDTHDYTITEPLAPLSLSFAPTDILCHGDATGEIHALVDGGTPGYTYTWSNGGTTSAIIGLTANNYSLTVTDNHGCAVAGSQILTEPAAPLDATSIITDVDCHGNNTGSIDVTTTGGTVPYAFVWNNSATLILVDTTEDITAQFADSYTLTVTDNNGCTFELNSVITEPAAPLAITGTVDDVNCFGINDGAIDITVTGGTAAYGYNWSSGQITEDIATVISGNYSVIVTDANNCQDSLAFFINQPAAPLVIETIVTDVLCNGGTTGAIDATITGGTLPYAYDWSNAETTEDLENLPANIYTLNVTDAQGCTAFTGATVNEPDALVVTPTVTDASCYNYSDGEILLTISGGIQPYYFNWGNQNEIMLNNPSETINALIAEDYFIRVRDENGCIHEQYVSVGQPAPFTADYVITDPLCFEGTDGNVDITITGGTQPYSTLWSDGQTTEDAINLGAGDYSFVVTDDQGCKIEESLEVGQPQEIQISSQIEPVSCIDQSDAAIYVTPFGGTMPYTYSWTTGSSEQNAEGLPPATYEIVITDDHLCSETFTFEIATNFEECLIIPNTFTPNGDDYNDTWVIGNLELYPDATVKVFNQWGNQLFSSEGLYTPWDGTHHDKPLPADVYYYIIILNNNENNEYTGTITIVR